MSERCPHSPRRGTGWLVGWRLTFGGEDFGWDGAMTTIVEAADHQVFVALYDVTTEDETRLDEAEGGPRRLYRKIRVRVHTLEGERVAWTYALDTYEGGLPSAGTIGLLSEAAAAAGAPDDYVADLRSRPCRSFGL